MKKEGRASNLCLWPCGAAGAVVYDLLVVLPIDPQIHGLKGTAFEQTPLSPRVVDVYMVYLLITREKS